MFDSLKSLILVSTLPLIYFIVVQSQWSHTRFQPINYSWQNDWFWYLKDTLVFLKEYTQSLLIIIPRENVYHISNISWLTIKMFVQWVSVFGKDFLLLSSYLFYSPNSGIQASLRRKDDDCDFYLKMMQSYILYCSASRRMFYLPNNLNMHMKW